MQNITARNETRYHLLLKTGQMITQTSASRGYVLFDIKMAFRHLLSGCQQGAHTKVLKLSAVCGHTTWNVPNLEKHRCSRMFDAAWLEIPDFAIRMPLPAVFWNFVFSDISIIKHLPFRLQKSGSYFSSEESSRSFMLPYMPASFPRRASSNGMSAPAGSTSGL